MNRFTRVIAIFLCFSVMTGLVSCERETVISPIRPTAEQEQSIALDGDEIVVSVAKKYTLTKHGNTTLTYYTDGKLKKVTLSPSHYIDYTYSDSTRVYSKEYSDNKLDVVTTYYIHKAQAAGGQNYEANPPANAYYKNYPDQCYMVTTQRYMHYVQGDEIIKTDRVYIYNDKGQIAKVYLSNFQPGVNTNKRVDFTYSTDGDLMKATEYNGQNVKIRESTFEYSAFGDPILNDRNPLNPEELPVDPYVKVFGKYSKHLARGKKREEFAPYKLVYTYFYQYTRNIDGYVMKQDTYLLNAQLLQTTAYDYASTSPRIQ